MAQKLEKLLAKGLSTAIIQANPKTNTEKLKPENPKPT